MTDKTDIELMQQALDAMMDAIRVSGGISDKMFESVGAISERLAQQEQERREWQGLTNEEVGALTVFDGLHHVEIPILANFVWAVEAKLKEKNT